MDNPTRVATYTIRARNGELKCRVNVSYAKRSDQL